MVITRVILRGKSYANMFFHDGGKDGAPGELRSTANRRDAPH